MFNGLVDGGNLIGGGAISTFELAPSASQGSISGLGAQFVDFEQFVVDAGADWQLTGANSLAVGSILTNQGTLKLIAANLIDNGVVVNNGVLNIDPSMLTVATLTGTGSVDIGLNSTLDAQGTVSSGQTIDLSGLADA